VNALDLVGLEAPVPPGVATKLRRARTALLFRHPFSAAVLLRCRWIVTHRVPTAMIDGSHLWINPDFVAGLSPAETLGLLHHEALHVAYAHHLRCGERDSKLWNRAGDYVINSEILRLPGAKLPPDGLIDPQYAGWSAERVYARLATPPEPPPEPESPPPPETSPDPQDSEPPEEAAPEPPPAPDDPDAEPDESTDDIDSANSEASGDEEDPQQSAGGQDSSDPCGTDHDSDTSGADLEDLGPAASDDTSPSSPDSSSRPTSPSQGSTETPSTPSQANKTGPPNPDAGSAPDSASHERPFPDSFYPPDSTPDSGFGDVVEPRHADASPLEPCELEALEKELAIELHQVAQACGTGSPAIARRLAEMRTPRLDVRETLLRYASEISAAHDDLSLARRNRRYLAVLPDVGMPGPYCETLGHVVAVVDTSGSLDSTEIALFLGTLEEILRAFPAIRLTVVAADDRLHEVTEIPAGATELPSLLPLSGQGGTDFRPAIAWAEIEADAPPSLLVYLTDGHGPAPDAPPPFPVLWALHEPGRARTPASWGEVAYLHPGSI